jgi:fibronectin type 3 domain-containing protein
LAAPAPQAVYQTIRFGDFSYLFPALTPGAPYTVRLHFAESFTNFIGERVFDVTVNGAKVLPRFDILAATGALEKAVVEQFDTTADASGQISVQLTSLVGGSILSGIEILTGSAVPSAPYGLRAVAGNDQVTLTWLGGGGATSFNVYRGTAAGGETLVEAGVSGPSFVDTGVSNGTSYFYRVSAVNDAGEGSQSGEASATPTPGPAPVYRIRCGSNVAAPPFQQDQYFTGGGTAGTGQTIDVSGVANPAPQAVYQTIRDGDFSYVFPTLTPGAPYTVRLHFAESFTNFIGERVFDVSINGVTVFPRFDILAAAGAPGKAVVEQFNATADAGGNISLQTTTHTGGAILSGIEILTGSAVPSSPYGLRAVAGNGQVALTWLGGAGASSFNVYRGTSPGNETPYETGVPSPAFVDAAAANGTTYFYVVTAADAAGEGAISNEASATPTTGPAPVYRIRCGSNIAAPPYQQDQYFSGGGSATTGQAIDVSGVVDPAPQAVYQSIRDGDFTYLFPGLAPGATYTVRLHFAESFTNFIGNRVFNVALNGAQVLSNFDIIAVAGGTEKAIVEQFDTPADAGGQISLQVTTLAGGAILSGIEVLTGAAIPSAPFDLRAVPGDGRVTLTWRAEAGATSYNVYRGTAPGAEALYHTGVGTPSFVDDAAANGTAYFYVVTALNDAGESAASSEATATPTPGPAPVYRIACGNNAAVPPFQVDQFFTGGGTAATGLGIDTAGVVSPAPQAVYQRVRYGNFSYAFPGLTPGAPYTVRLHFAESFTNLVGARIFDLAINGTAALSGFDVIFAAGRPETAIVEQFNASADGSGQITLQFSSTVNGGIVSGIEILTGSAVPSAPYGLRGQPGDNQVTLSWQAGAGATSFSVYRGPAPGAETLYQAGLASPSFVDVAAVNGTRYFYTVTALNGVGESAPSGEARVTPAPPTCQAPLYAETWDTGTSAWRAVDANPITVVNDGSACGPFQRESVFFSAGRVFTQAGIPVSAAAPYCLSAWIRGSSGANPFLGIQLSDINGNLAGQEHWLIGQAGYPTNYGDTVTAVTSNGAWAWYAKPFTMEAGATAVVLKDENNAGGTADFDTIELLPGDCPAPPATACAAPAPNCP